MNIEKKSNNNFVKDIKCILNSARKQAYSAVNSAIVQAYWMIGERIVEEQQKGQERAKYGKYILKTLAKELSNEFGKGLDERELRRIRQFYLTFPIRDTLRPELSWSHYRLLIRVTDEKARSYYLTEAAEQHWSYRTLDRNYSTQYYQRLLSSTDKQPVVSEMQAQTAEHQHNKHEFIKNPYILEFLQLEKGGQLYRIKIRTGIADKYSAIFARTRQRFLICRKATTC